MSIPPCFHATRNLVAVLTAFLCAVAPNTRSAEQATTTPLRQAHSHNDYLHTRPLLDALDHGFCSVEADIWLVDGKLLVAHDLKEARPERTLQALYIEPLAERVKINGGRVFRGGPEFTLLVDVKSDATNTYKALRLVLQDYTAMLTRFSGQQIETNAVTIVISGNRARALMADEPMRLAAYDGRLPDLDAPATRGLIPLVSDNWTLHFKWRGRDDEGPLPEAERMKLRSLVTRAHEQGRRVRFWAAPDKPAMWDELHKAGVDYLNTDRLADLGEFLRHSSSRP
jgi:Glycerophosphoryl diester phosphodiesterase family